LTKDFLIPTTWLDECRALRARFYADPWTECRLLLSAGLFSEAHKVVVWDLAPEAVVRSDFEMLESMFVELKDVSTQVANWQTGGQVRCCLL
jgi:nuclear pore complex protein Nup98-Nup96